MSAIPRRSFLRVAAAAPLAGLAGCGGCSRTSAPVPEDQAAPTPGTASAGGKHALLVGVTRYPPVRLLDVRDPKTPRQLERPLTNLEGCGNDARLVGELLRSRFGFAAADVVTLTEDDGPARRPTRGNIARELDRLAAAARAGDQVVLLLAGHGTQQPDHGPADPDDPEPDGLDEVFLPADVRDADLKRLVIPNAIVDDELRVWVKRITDQGARVFFLADCCHSGTLLRNGGLMPGVRGIPVETLWPPDVLAAAARRKATVQPTVPPSPWQMDRHGAAVALYATQPDQLEVERWFPSRGAPGARCHGLLTYAVCEILSQAESPLTYRDLARMVPSRYAGWGLLTPPTPFAEGADLDREVLGERRWPGRSSLLLAHGAAGWEVNGGKLHGLHAGSVLAVHPPAGTRGPDRVLGHVRVRASDALRAQVEPCAHAGLPPPRELLDESRAEPAVVVFDFARPRVSLAELSEADRRALAAVVAAAPADADWVVRREGGKLWLLPAAAGSVRFELAGDDLAAALRGRLAQVARGQNLLRVAAESTDTARGRGAVHIDVEIRKLRNERDPEGTPLEPGRAGLRLRSGEWVRVRAHNRGKKPADVTLLAVFADFSVHCFFPEATVHLDNRVPPGRWAQTEALQMNADTTGTEYWVAIATEAAGPQISFACLAEPTYGRARGATLRGDTTPVLQTPLGRLMAHALYGEGGTRGVSAAYNYQTRILPWVTEANR